MTAARAVLAMVLLVVAASIGVGATTPTATPAETTAPEPMGEKVSAFMAASVAQADGSVENGMWVAAYANASTDGERRALVETRMGSLDSTVEELRAERETLQAAYENGSIDRVQYRARLGVIVGQLAALGESVESTDRRGRAVGVNVTRLDTLRTQARTVGGGPVSAMAHNLSSGHGSPRADIFGDDHPAPPGPGGPPDGAVGNETGPPSGGSGQSTDRAAGPPGEDSTATTSTADDD